MKSCSAFFAVQGV